MLIKIPQLAELKSPLINVKEALYGPDGVAGADSSGILGAVLGESPAEAAARVEEAKKTANDLTGLVRRKKGAKSSEATPEPGAITNGANGKRKAEDDADDSDNVKKARVEDVPEE